MYSETTEKILSTLAKSNKYQTLYSLYKESNIFLFRNMCDYTTVQIYFLNLLSSYNSILVDIAVNEVDSIVLTDDIYEEAYLYYKYKERKKEFNKVKNKQPETNQDKKAFSWVFKKPNVSKQNGN